MCSARRSRETFTEKVAFAMGLDELERVWKEVAGEKAVGVSEGLLTQSDTMREGGHGPWGGDLGVTVCVQAWKVRRKCQRVLTGVFMNVLWVLWACRAIGVSPVGQDPIKKPFHTCGCNWSQGWIPIRKTQKFVLLVVDVSLQWFSRWGPAQPSPWL